MELIAGPCVAIAILVFAATLLLRLLAPHGVGVHVVAQLLSYAVLGVWHFIFGPPKVRIAKNRSRRTRGGRHG